MSNLQQFLEKVIEATQVGKLFWKRIYYPELNRNPMFVEYWEQNSNDETEHFYAKYGDSYFYIFTKRAALGKYFLFATQNSVMTKVNELNGDREFQAELVRLYNLVKNKVDGPDALITNFLREI